MVARCRSWRNGSLLISGAIIGAACGGSPTVSLTTNRLGHTSEAIGNYLYVFGGSNLNTIDRATVDDDGTLGAFATLTGVTLASPRTGHTSAIIGDFVYVFGGATDRVSAPGSSSIERASINPDGSIGSFAIVSGITLTTPRITHASAIWRSYIYVVGGAQNGTSLLDTVERATINPDGSLGQFMTLPGVTLQTPRRNVSSVALGNYLYVLGGSGPSGALDSIERSPIGSDGSLGAFETLTDVKLGSPGFDQAFVMIADRLYVTGGLHGGLVPSNAVAVSTVAADGAIAAFASAGSGLSVARGSHTATVLKDYLYVLGGKGSADILTSVERAAINADDTLADFENLSD